MKRFLLTLALLPTLAISQSPPWDVDVINWAYAPVDCVDGRPLSECAVTSFTVQEAASATASSWATAGTASATARSITLSARTVGPHCYRVIANAGNVPSAPSNVGCQTTVDTRPAPQPRPPQLITIDGNVLSVQVDYTFFRFLPSKVVGTLPLGSRCDSARSIGNGYYAVARSEVRWTGSNRPENVVARCGPRA